ncbi:MFS transporter [Fictibacillus sp. b24]|uniref:MFS transporter n=1 Tax=Fictibacillus sp. b24 TaxID=3055863 RepID=UPI0025A0D413|nr:MFS transporter [Fictibacillus sp. b24]MDM5317116.1 MFS transporter [Fictibacillus sp. b24]
MNKNRSFLFLLLGQSLVNIGDVLYIVALISALYTLTESAAVSAFVPFTVTFAMFISSILTPLIIGRVNLKAILLWSQIGKTLLLLSLGFFMITSLNLSNYYITFLIIGGIALLDGCANPVRQALIPYYVKEENLIQANGLAETITQSIQIGTWFFGSLLLLVINPNHLIWIVVSLFAIASCILIFLKKVKHQTERQENNWDLLTQGWRTIRHTPVLKTLVQMEFFETIAGAVWIAAVMYVFVDKALRAGEQWWGFLNGSFFIGLVIGSIVCVRFPQYVDKNRNVFIVAGASMACILTVIFSMTSNAVFALMLSALIGFFGQLKNIPQQTVIQTSVPNEHLATVYTSIGTVSTGVFGFASLFMGVLSDFLGVRSVYFLSGILLLIVSVLAFKDKKLFMKNEKMQHSA